MAAAIRGVFHVCLDQQQACVEDDEMKKKQVALMERLRSKRNSQHRSWTDSLMKSIRTTVVDRRLQADSSERGQVQKCLDTLQRAMKVISQRSLVERLDLIARQQGLMFHYSDNDQPLVTLQADMFHIEIILSKGGGVKEVKIAHQGDASVCHELTDILCRGDFPEFTSHLEGLQSIYQVTTEKKLKSKAFLALQSLEKDLNHVAQFQNSISGVANYIHKSPLGILLPRTAGKPMKLIYFVSPYDLLDKKTLSAHPMTVEAITEHGLGRSVTVCLEAGPSNKLQTMPLLSVNKISEGNCLPSYNALTHANSALLPARFVLVLPQPIPVSRSIIQKIQMITALDTGKDMGSQPLLSLILDSNSDGKMKKDQQLFVSLPDQHHWYFISGVSGGPLDEPGVMLSRIPFCHPTHVPNILNLLRQQLLFNSLLASCVRPSAKKDPATSLVFEMTVISLTQMMVVFEHPARDTMVTVDIDMTDITSLKCRMQHTSTEHSLCSDDYASRVLQRCLSLPILLRSLVRKGRSQLEKLMAEAKALAEEQARRAQEAAIWAAAQARQQQPRFPPSVPTKGRPPPPQVIPPQLTPTYPPTPSPVTSNPPSVGGMGDLRGIAGGVDLLCSSPPGYPAAMGPGGEGQDKQNNPLLVNLLDGERCHTSPIGGPQQQQTAMPVTESPMLSRLLEDNISVATNITPISTPAASLPQPQPKPKGSKGRKRRAQSDISTGRSPKHRMSESDASERYGSIDLDSSSSSFESSLVGPGALAGFHHQMGPVQSRPLSQGHMTSIIDLTDENPSESSLKKLVDLMPRDVKQGTATPDSELQALLSQQDHTSSPSAGLKSNQVTGSKNENASTSPEGLLIGSGEVGKASLPDPAAVHPKVSTPSRVNTTNACIGHGSAIAKARRDSDLVGFHQQPGGSFSHQHDISHHLTSIGNINMGGTSSPAQAITRPKVVSSSSMTDMLDIKVAQPHGKKVSGLKGPGNADSVLDKPGLFEKFDFAGQSVSSAHVTITSSIPASSSVAEGDDLMAPKVRLKLQTFRTPHNKSQSLDSSVVQSPSSAGSKSSNSNTFDFRSDEEDDEPVTINYVPTDRLSVYAPSPTRLQISSKGKPTTPLSTPETPPSVKPQKCKRRDKSSGNTKRKKDRDESKKERKKKRFDHDHYLPTGKEPVYRASTIESDQKTGTKLKIRVSKEPIKTLSPVKESSRVDMSSEKVGKFSERVNDALRRRPTPSNPVVEKLVLQKQDIRDHHHIVDDSSRDREVTHLYRSSLSVTGKSLKTGSGKAGIGSSNSALSKSDPKLAKATIRLKPLNIISNTSASVNLTPSLKSSSGGRSISDRSERRSQSLSSSASVSTPTTGTLSLSSILPNAPTASSVASLPPIPKIPKVSSVTSTTTTTTSPSNATAKSGLGVANNRMKNSNINSNFNNSINKLSGSPSGGRPGNNPNMSSALKSPNMGFNKAGGSGGTLKSSNISGNKTAGNTCMPPGILKNSGNFSAQKTATVGHQGLQKGLGGSNQLCNSYSRSPVAASQTVGIHKSSMPNQGLNKNSASQVVGSVSRMPNNGNQALQKGLSGVYKSPTLPNQGGSSKVSGSPNQNIGVQKASPSVKTAGTGSLTSQHRTYNQNSNQAQINSTQGGNFGPKHSGSVTSSSTGSQSQGQKLSNNQGRSMSTNSYNSSPNGTGRSSGNVKNNSVTGTSGGGRTPPNHLSVNRSMSVPGQKIGSGSSPRTLTGQNSSNTSAPRFTGNSPQHKSSGASPSSVSQRSGSTSQTPSQRGSSINASQSGTNLRSSIVSSQRQASSPQTHRSVSNNCGSSPNNQRPASTPGTVTDQRLSSSGTSQSPGYPVRPSSAGPRQSSSPVGQSSNSSPVGNRTSSPGGQGQRTGNNMSVMVSPLVSHQSANAGTAEITSLTRQNSSSNLNPNVSRQNAAGSSRSNPAVSRQNVTLNSTAAGGSRQNSSGNSNTPTLSDQTSNANSSTPAVMKQLANNSSSSSTTSRQNSNGGGGSVHSANLLSKHLSTSGSSASVASSVSCSSASDSVAAAVSQQINAQGGTTLTSGKQLSSGSSTVSTSNVVSSSRISSAVTPGSQRTSSSVSFNQFGNVKNMVSGSKSVVSKMSSGASGLKAASGGGGGGGGGGNSITSKGANNVSKANALMTSSADCKIASDSVILSLNDDDIESSTATVAKGGTGMCTSVNVLASSDSSISSIGPKIQSPSLSAAYSLSAAALTASALTSAPNAVVSSAVINSKTVAAGAARSRKGSLSAIVDKLTTRVSASSGPGSESGECTGNAGGASPVLSISKAAEALVERHLNVTDEGSEGESRTGVKRLASVSGLSPSGSDQKVPRLESHGKPAVSTSTVPSPAHSASPHTSAPLSAVERRRSGSVGEKNSPSLPRESGEMGLDLSLPKDKSRLELASVPTPLVQLDCLERASPKETSSVRSGSPAVGVGSDKTVSGMKFNGDSSKDKSRSESEVFKVPTPKNQSCEEEECCGRIVSTSPVCNTSSRSFHAPTSPLSDASSPENELIIDCGESPNLSNSRPASLPSCRTPVNPSPKRVIELAGEGAPVCGLSRASPAGAAVRTSPSPNDHSVKNSPQPSSHPRLSPTRTSSASPAANEAGVNSPCEIDDDLMDAALMGFPAS